MRASGLTSTPVSFLILVTALSLAVCFTSCHFFWKSLSSACCLKPCNFLSYIPDKKTTTASLTKLPYFRMLMLLYIYLHLLKVSSILTGQSMQEGWACLEQVQVVDPVIGP